MGQIAITVERREEAGKGIVGRLRRSGWVPGILYGEKRAPVPVKMVQHDLETAFPTEEQIHQSLSVTVVDGGKKEKIMALLKDFQADMISRDFTHFDLWQVAEDQVVTVKVPLRLTGKAEGLKEGGIMEAFLREIPVMCMPKDIPLHIDYDVTAMGIGDTARFSEVALPKGCALPRGVDDVFVSVHGKEEEEVVAAAPTAEAGATPAEGAAAPAAPGAAGAKGAAAPAAAGAKAAGAAAKPAAK